MVFYCRRLRSRRPSSRFPFTTLFRSRSFRLSILLFAFALSAVPVRAQGGPGIPIDHGLWQITGTSPNLPQEDLEPLRQDRKSTRLNSSHVKIPHAVVCVKKKYHNPAH